MFVLCRLCLGRDAAGAFAPRRPPDEAGGGHGSGLCERDHDPHALPPEGDYHFHIPTGTLHLPRFSPSTASQWCLPSFKWTFIYAEAQKQTAFFESTDSWHVPLKFIAHVRLVMIMCLHLRGNKCNPPYPESWSAYGGLWWVQFCVRPIDGAKNMCGCSSRMSFGSQRSVSVCMLGSGCIWWKMSSAPIRFMTKGQFTSSRWKRKKKTTITDERLISCENITLGLLKYWLTCTSCCCTLLLLYDLFVVKDVTAMTWL